MVRYEGRVSIFVHRMRAILLAGLCVLCGAGAVAQDRVTFHGQPLFLSGLNLAWGQNPDGKPAFGDDVGPNTDTPDTDHFRSVFARVQAHGGNTMRLWVHTHGGATPAFNGLTSVVVGPGEGAIDDLKTILDLAWEHRVGMILCLWSFDMQRKPYGTFITERTRDLLTIERFRTAYIDNALVPMVRALKGHPALLAWEIFNEPEGMSEEFGWDFTRHVPMSDIQAFINTCAGAIHRTDPGAKVTNGAWSFYSATDVGQGNRNYYTDERLIAAGGDPDGTLDFYTVHFYDWAGEGRSPFHHDCAHWELDKPLVIAEFHPDCAEAPYETLYRRGYAGALAWSWTDGYGEAILAQTAAMLEAHPEDVVLGDPVPPAEAELRETDPGASRPNILVILTDDQGYGDLQLHGNTAAVTPRMNQLAAESVRLDQFHAAPVCAPTRASLMTGRQFLTTGVWGVHGGRDYLNLDQTTLAEILGEAGYDTAMLGKWHLGKTRAYLPYERGFDQAWTITDRLYQHTNPVIDHNGTTLRPSGWTVDYLTDRGIEWMTRRRGRPFFLYLAHPLIHEPYHAPKDMVSSYMEKGHSETMATLLAMVEQLDTATGRLLDALDESGLADDTVVFYLGDNGPIGNCRNLPHLTGEEMAQRNPTGLRGVKSNLYENGMKVPAFVRWPGRFEPGITQVPLDMVDIAPTALDLAGVPPRLAERMDGRSFLPLLRDTSATLPDRPYFYANHELFWPAREALYSFLPGKEELVFDRQVLAVREGRYKLVMGYGNIELFDLAADPGERTNLAGLDPRRRDRMLDRLRTWWEAEVLNADGTYDMPVFHPGFHGERRTYLHGCAPVAVHGGIRTGSHGTHDWRASGDGQEFAIEVADPVTFRVGVDYEAGQPRGTLAVRVAGQEISGPIEPGTPLWLGKVTLPGGRHGLNVRLADVPDGHQVVIKTFRGVVMERVD